ncbi:MAG: class I SAM-dependent methyltransferase [Pyrinomonadaceae bacterium]
MKKFVIGLVAVKLTFLISLAALFLTGQGDFPVSSQTRRKTPTPTATPADDTISRPTSEPFKGDLSRYDREGRAEKLQIERVMDLLGIAAGKSVADIGAGGGWFSAIASKRVGEKGIVYAVDVNEDAIKYINERKEKENLINIRAILGTTEDPLLPKKSVDAVLILNTYHEFGQPVKLMKNLRAALKKDALVGIIDRDGRGDDHGIDQQTIIEEAGKAGYELKGTYDFVEDTMDYFLIFRVK